MTNPLIDASRRPIHECLIATQEIAAELSGKMDQTGAGLCLVLVPLMTYIPSKIAHSVAGLRTVNGGAAIERYRLKNGMLPERLEALVPAFLEAVPEDPFDGQPLRYKVLEKGYVVYSVGDDGEDDGGKEPENRGERGGDVCFRVERQ